MSLRSSLLLWTFTGVWSFSLAKVLRARRENLWAPAAFFRAVLGQDWALSFSKLPLGTSFELRQSRPRWFQAFKSLSCTRWNGIHQSLHLKREQQYGYFAPKHMSFPCWSTDCLLPVWLCWTYLSSCRTKWHHSGTGARQLWLFLCGLEGRKLCTSLL